MQSVSNGSSIPKMKPVKSEDAIANELNQLNQRYSRLLQNLHRRLQLIKQVYDTAGVYFPVSEAWLYVTFYGRLFSEGI